MSTQTAGRGGPQPAGAGRPEERYNVRQGGALSVTHRGVRVAGTKRAEVLPESREGEARRDEGAAGDVGGDVPADVGRGRGARGNLHNRPEVRARHCGGVIQRKRDQGKQLAERGFSGEPIS